MKWNTVIDFVKKQWLQIWIAVAILALVGMGSMAAYISAFSSMKRVVVSTSNQGKLFTSNILVEDGKDIYIPRYFPQLVNPSATYSVDVILWNYNLSNPAKWYSEMINYNVTFTLTDSEGHPLTAADMGSRTVIVSDKNGNTLATLDGTTPTLTYTRTGESLAYNASTSTEGKYTLDFSGNWDLENDTEICVQVDIQLSGSESQYLDLSPLGGIIGLKKAVNTESAGWQAYIAERENSVSVADCDGYNMTVTGAGAAVITIKWDTRYLECNRNFYNQTIYSFGTGEVVYTAPASGSNIATLVISADTASSVTDNRNRYDIQFYKTGTAEPSSWSFITNDESSLSDSVWLFIGVEQ